MNQTLEADVEVSVRDMIYLSESAFMQVWDNPEEAVYDGYKEDGSCKNGVQITKRNRVFPTPLRRGERQGGPFASPLVRGVKLGFFALNLNMSEEDNAVLVAKT